MTALLEIQNISKAFFGIHAVKDVSLTINKGESVGLIGRTARAKVR